MNFIGAIQHATIGYGIRRRSWTNKDIILYLEQTLLRQVNSAAPLYLLCNADFIATDWEAI